jgi:hypothetical protein
MDENIEPPNPEGMKIIYRKRNENSNPEGVT